MKLLLDGACFAGRGLEGVRSSRRGVWLRWLHRAAAWAQLPAGWLDDYLW